jgi:hypothetical protein
MYGLGYPPKDFRFYIVDVRKILAGLILWCLFFMNHSPRFVLNDFLHLLAFICSAALFISYGERLHDQRL